MNDKYIFVGEKRSNRAIEMGVTWQDGHLAAKTLFEALEYCNIPIKNCLFVNLWNDHDQLQSIPTKGIVVGMGRRVQKQLDKLGVTHLKLTHPAARGKIRKHESYMAHAKHILKGS